MVEFALVPDTRRNHQPVCGLIVNGSIPDAFYEKLNQRQAHYSQLYVAKGDGWLALYSDSDATVNLPWIAGAQCLYFYRLHRSCLCRIGYRPNVPEHLLPGVLEKVQLELSHSSPIALVPNEAMTVMYSFANSVRLKQINLSAMQ